MGQPEVMCFLIKCSNKYTPHLWSSLREQHNTKKPKTQKHKTLPKFNQVSRSNFQFKENKVEKEQGKGHSEDEIRSKSKYTILYRQIGLPWWLVKNPPATWETWVRSLGWEDPLEESMATHSSILAWRISLDRGAWQITVHGVAKSWTQLSD